MKRTTWFILILTVKILAAAPAQAIVVEKHVLPNGLTVLLQENRRLPKVTVFLWYKVGSRDEQPGKTGSAHFFEHFMYKGNKYIADGEQDKTVLKCKGKLNANTYFDRTVYYQTFGSECLEEILRNEAVRMGFLAEGMRQDNFDSERRIVIEELAERKDVAYGQKYKTILEQAFPQGHPYNWEPGGKAEDLNTWQLEEAKEFFSNYYRPNNAVLSISGKFDSKETLEMVRKWFGPLKAGPPPPPAKVAPNTDKIAVKRGILEDSKVEIPSLTIAYRIPGVGKPGSIELSILGDLLAGSRTSPLVNHLQYERKLVLEIGIDSFKTELEDLFLVEAYLAPGVDPDAVEAAIREEIQKALKEGVDTRKLKGMKKKLQTSGLMALQSTMAMAQALAQNEAVHGDYNYLEQLISEIEAIQPENILKVGRQYLRDGNSTVLTIIPKAAGGVQ